MRTADVGKRVLLSQYADETPVGHNDRTVKVAAIHTRTQQLFHRAWDELGSDRWRVVDIILATAAALAGLADLVYDIGSNGASFTWMGSIVVIAACAALLIRHRFPISVLAFVSLARIGIALEAGTEVALSIPAAVAFYSLARSRSRLEAIAAAGASAIVAAIAILIVSPNALIEEGLTEIVIVLLVLAVAEVVRTNQARTSERIAAEATERVHAERLRIARDLHDVVAHSLSNIAVQSGVAARLIDTNPEHAKKALEIINDAGRNSLEELRSLLGLLRSEEDDLETRPTPGQLDDINEIIARAAESGLDIEVVRTDDFPSAMPPGVVLATCRIIQESLTNVSRHAGPVSVLLELHHNDDQLNLRITNAPGATDRPQVPSTGVGIIGMTERAEALGGQLSTRQLPDGGFLVKATLPHHENSEQS